MFRKDLLGHYGYGDEEQENVITKLQVKRVKALLRLGMDVIVADSNLPNRSVKRWMQVCHDEGAQGFTKDFRHVDLETVLANNNTAERRANGKYRPSIQIRDKYERYIEGRDLNEPVSFTPKARLEVVPYEQPIESKALGQKAVIFDIDGTLAVMGDRDPYEADKVWMDTVNEDVHKALDMHYWKCHRVIIVTGRDEIYREVTEEWLKLNGIHHDELLMRPTEPGQKLDDWIIKYELFNQHIRPKNYRIFGVYDDRHRVLRMWRKLGLTTFHVNGPDAGDF